MIDRVNGVPCLTKGDVHTAFQQNEKVTGTVSLTEEDKASLWSSLWRDPSPSSQNLCPIPAIGLTAEYTWQTLLSSSLAKTTDGHPGAERFLLP